MPSHRFFKQRLLFLIPLLVFVVYLPCLKADFVNWDDDIHVLQNFTLKSPIRWAEIWATTVNYIYIPLTTTSWAIERNFFGDNPFVFHLDNILVHLVVTALVIVFSRRMGLSIFAAGVTAFLFGIHPMHVESVAWVSERKDVLYGVFYMLALLAYLDYLDKREKKYFWVTVFLGVCSILAKPMAVSLPFVLFILDWFRGRQWTFQTITEKVLCAFFLIPIAFISYLTNGIIVQPAQVSGPFNWVWCFMFYLYKFVFPWPLVILYECPQSEKIFYIHVPLFVSLILLLWLFRRNRLLLFAFAFYFANIFFLLKFHSTLIWVSDRYMYLASIGLCMFLAVLVEKMGFFVKSRRLYRYGFNIALGVLMVVMAAMTWRQCEVWQSSVKLWSHQLRYEPKTATWLVYSKLADAYLAENEHSASHSPKFDRIRMLYLKAIQSKPDFLNAYLGLGGLFESVGDGYDAEKCYVKILFMDNKNYEALFRLGQIYQKRELPGQAINFYRRAIAANPYLCSYIRDAYDDAIQKHQDGNIYQKERSKIPACS